MTIKRTVLALATVVAPLVACGSSSTGESSTSSSAPIFINPRSECAPGPQAPEWWASYQETLDSALAWYLTGMTDPTGPGSVPYVAFAGMIPGTATVQSIAWVPQSAVGTFEYYNPTCSPGSGSSPTHIPYVSNQSGGGGGVTPTRCPPYHGVPTLPTSCVTIGDVDQFADENDCPRYVNAGSLSCPLTYP